LKLRSRAATPRNCGKKRLRDFSHNKGQPVRRIPTGNFERRVNRRKDKPCLSWRTHFPKGSCAREVASVLELWAKNNDSRVVYASVPEITKACNGKYRVGGKKSFSQSAVEKALRQFRLLQILGPRRVHMFDGMVRLGSVYNAHDSMTQAYPLACSFIGAGKRSGTWTVDGEHFTEAHFHTFQNGELGAAALMVESTVPSVVPLRGGMWSRYGAVTVSEENFDVVRDGGGDGVETPEHEQNTSIIGDEPDFLAGNGETKCAPNPVNPFSQVSPVNKTNTNPLNPDPNDKDAVVVSTTELTDLTKDAATVIKVKDHFVAGRISSARDLFALLTDGELEFENPTMRAYENAKGNSDFQFEDLARCCRDVLAKNADKPLLDRRTLADLMHECATLLMARHERKAPKSWYFIINNKLRAGDPAIREKDGGEKTFDRQQRLRNYCNPYAHTWLHEVFHNAVMNLKVDLTPWEKYFINFEPKDSATYKHGWEWVHVLMTYELKDTPAEIVAVRDWLWEADAMHQKKDVPLWRTE
jgi:hypothetical protein